MRTDPLLTVLKIAAEAENQAAIQLKAAQLEVQKLEVQLESLENYRLDYMKQFGSQTNHLSSSYFQQFHQFINQVDKAITKQQHDIYDAKVQRKHRQSNWLAKQQKRKAVELLLEQKRLKVEIKAAKQEQKMADEFAMQQFFRKKN